MYYDKQPIKSDGGATGYYDLPEFATELQHLIEHKRMSFAQGNIFKAAYRLGEKEGVSVRYDLNKIIRFANFMLQEMDRQDAVKDRLTDFMYGATDFAKMDAHKITKEEYEELPELTDAHINPCPAKCAEPSECSPSRGYTTVSAPGYKTRGNARPLTHLADVGDKILIHLDADVMPSWRTVYHKGDNMVEGAFYRVDHHEGNKSNLLIVPHHHVLDIDKPF